MEKFKSEMILAYKRSKAMLMLFVLMFAFALYFTDRYTIAFNGANSDCLNSRAYLIDKWDSTFTNDQLIAFTMNVENGIHKKGTTWVKKVAGIPGQKVFVTHEDVIVENKRYPLTTSYVLGKLNKDFDSVKNSWELGKNDIFMIGETITSFDSRFWGPIQKNDVVGKAYAIF